MAIFAQQVIYSGNVQGVGFRFRATECAQGLNVTGYVRNIANGDVELVVEGASSDVAALKERIHLRMGSNIRGVSAKEIAVSGSYPSFAIWRD